LLTNELRERLDATMEQMEREGRRDPRRLGVSSEQLCPTRDNGVEGYVECLDTEAARCDRAVSFGGTYLCRCPVRVKLKKIYGL